MGSLNPVEATVFAISEAEVYCDMDGIESLLDRYGIDAMERFATAFLTIGASEIAAALHAISAFPLIPVPRELLSLANELVSDRKGYSYENIASFVERST